MFKTSPSPTSKDGTIYESNCHLSVEDRTSFFQIQLDQCLSGARTGCHTNLNFVSKSGAVVSAHQAVLLPFSSHLKSLVESSNSCGCIEDVPTLLLPDWDHKVLEALLKLLYSGSVTVTDDVTEEILSLMSELRFDISRDQLLTTPVIPLPVNTPNQSVSPKNPIEDGVVAENQMSTDSSKTSENSSDYKIGWIPSIEIENIETETKSEEQEKVIKKLSALLDFLKCVNVKNKESFVMITKPLEDLLSSWKYLPTEPSFNSFPIEIKRHILSYLCKSGAFLAASVCREWKKILKNRLIMMREVTIGKHCSNIDECEDGRCFMPEELLKASLIVKLDVRLRICHPIMNVDPNLLAEALINVSGFGITNDCNCDGVKDFHESKKVITQNQMEVLFENLEQKEVKLLSLELSLDMNNLNQDVLFNSLFKAKRLFLGSGSFLKQDLDEDGFIRKLLQTRNEFSHLYLERLEFWGHRLSNDLANALCRIKTVFLGTSFKLKHIEYLIQYILTHPIKTKNLFIQTEVNWRELLTTEELKALLNKLNKFAFLGHFSVEQVEAAWDIPGVYVERSTIIEDMQLITKGIYLDVNEVYFGIKLDRFCRNLRYWFV